MGISIMQGDSYQKPFTLRTLDGTLITPEMVTALVLSIGNLSRQYPGDITYADGKWLFPLSQAQTFGMKGMLPVQARVLFQDGSVFGGNGAPVSVLPAVNRGILDGAKITDGKLLSRSIIEVGNDAGNVSVVVGAAGVQMSGGSVQADWSQNDAEAADFVKNRPGAYMTDPVETEIFNGTLPEMAVIQMDYVPNIGDVVTVKVGTENIDCMVGNYSNLVYFATVPIEDIVGGTATNYVLCGYQESQWIVQTAGTYTGQNAVFEAAIRQAVKIPEKFLELENVKDIYWIKFEYDSKSKMYFSKKFDGTYAEYADIKAAIDSGKLVAAIASVFGEANNIGLVDGYGKYVSDLSASFYEVRDGASSLMNLAYFRWKSGHTWEKKDGSIEFSYSKPMPSTLEGKQGTKKSVARSDHSHPDRTSIQFLGKLTDGDEKTVVCGNVSPDTPFVVSGLDIPIGAEITLGFDDFTPDTPVTMTWGGTADAYFNNMGKSWRVSLVYNACTDAYTVTTTRALTNLTLTYKTVPSQTKDYQKYVLAPYTVAPHLLLASPNGLHKLTVDNDGNMLVDGKAISGTDESLGLTGASTGQSPIINTVDADGKPTVWEAAVLAKADGSNVPTSAMNTWRTNIAALPGVKVYGKADADGKIKAYTDADCTQEATSPTLIGIHDLGNALLIYDHKTYQCVGFEEPASMQGSGNYVVVVFFRSEIAADSAGAAVLKVETAKLNLIDYFSGAINAPIIITAGELSLTTTTTT